MVTPACFAPIAVVDFLNVSTTAAQQRKSRLTCVLERNQTNDDILNLPGMTFCNGIFQSISRRAERFFARKMEDAEEILTPSRRPVL